MPDLTLPIAAIRQAVARPEVIAALEAFFAETDRQIAAQPATCWNRGACCRFGQFGHRLYVTTLELVYYVAKGKPASPDGADACPHARDGRCQARDRRPLGCRVFYCDPAAQHWQGPLTEDRLRVLRDLHEQLGVPYGYVDWMAALKALHANLD